MINVTQITAQLNNEAVIARMMLALLHDGMLCADVDVGFVEHEQRTNLPSSLSTTLF